MKLTLALCFVSRQGLISAISDVCAADLSGDIVKCCDAKEELKQDPTEGLQVVLRTIGKLCNQREVMHHTCQMEHRTC